MATTEELEERLERVEALEAIRRVLADYALFHDQRRHSEMLTLFEDDCKLEVSGFPEQIPDAHVQGKDAIFEYYGGDRGPDDPPSQFHFKHVISNPQIVLDGDQATVVAYFDVTGLEVVQTGLYQERLRRGDDGQWRFTSKRIVGMLDQGTFEAINHEF